MKHFMRASRLQVIVSALLFLVCLAYALPPYVTATTPNGAGDPTLTLNPNWGFAGTPFPITVTGGGFIPGLCTLGSTPAMLDVIVACAIDGSGGLTGSIAVGAGALPGTYVFFVTTEPLATTDLKLYSSATVTTTTTSTTTIPTTVTSSATTTSVVTTFYVPTFTTGTTTTTTSTILIPSSITWIGTVTSTSVIRTTTTSSATSTTTVTTVPVTATVYTATSYGTLTSYWNTVTAYGPTYTTIATSVATIYGVTTQTVYTGVNYETKYYTQTVDVPSYTTVTQTQTRTSTTHLTATQTSTKIASTITQTQNSTSTLTIPVTTTKTTTQTNLQYTTGTESSASTPTITAPPPSGVSNTTAIMYAILIGAVAFVSSLLVRRWWTKRKEPGELPPEKPPEGTLAEEGKPTAEEALISPEPSNKICPNCKEVNASSAVWCSKCQAGIAAVPVTPAAATPEVAASIKCSRCSQQNAGNTEFCTNCGQKFEKPTATQAPSTPVAQVCQSCQTPRPSPQAQFCKRCGIKYPPPPQEEQGTTTEEDQREIELVREAEEQGQGAHETSEPSESGN